MNKKYQLLALLINLALIPSLFAGQTFEQFVEAQLAPLKNSKTICGVVIMSADDGKVIYQANADTPLAPASNQKILTTVSALGILGADYQFTTTLARGNDDLVIIGDGDPGFGDPELCGKQPITEVFDQWAQTLTAAKITQVSGKIVFDDTIFDRQFVHPNWPADQVNRWYTAPVGGLNLNDNCLDLSVCFGTDKKAQLVMSPATQTLSVEPEWIPVKGSNTIIWPKWESPQRLKVKIRLGSRGAGPVNVTVADPTLMFATVCREHLQAGGITIDGPIAFQQVRRSDGSLPENLTILAQKKTPIMDVVMRANKSSQNLFAECLFKRMGYQSARQTASFGAGTWSTGQLAAKAFLQDRVKVPIDNLVIDDGCGLSKYNRVTARTIASLLYFANKQPWADEFLTTLAVAGCDGTLKKRMNNGPADGKVLAKTGYIKGVSALSGYVLDGQDKPRVIFSMLFNFPPPSGKLWQVKAIEDKICTVLAKMLASYPTTQENSE